MEVWQGLVLAAGAGLVGMVIGLLLAGLCQAAARADECAACWMARDGSHELHELDEEERRGLGASIILGDGWEDSTWTPFDVAMTGTATDGM